MDSGLVIQIVTIIILLMLSAFFSSAETSLTCVNLVRIHTLAEGGDKRAARVEKILSNPGKMLSTILIGNNIVNISASSLVTTFTIKVFGNYAVGIATGVLTVLVLMFGEILPKTAANLCAEKLALAYSFFILKLIWLLTPIVFDLNDSLARDIMIPRIDMTMVDVETGYRSLQAVFKETMFSRIPVYEGEKDNIIGIVTLKDFFSNGRTDFSLRSIMPS